eukprot:GHVL01037905.1.p2 GENE.GHVL01037905.1~~GHVL01037905.1.p2  ORF type:complete len:105 (-),score=4.13 GHVL01037905.1:96-410(-)
MQEDVVQIAVIFTDLQHVFQHCRANAETSVGGQAAQGHDVETTLVLRRIHTTTHSADHDVIVVRQFCQLPHFQHVLVELVIVGDREDNLVQSLQLLDVVLGDVP